VLESRPGVDCAIRAPYGLTILDNCLTCPVREEHLFCNLPMSDVQKLNEIKSTAVYPKSALLFVEGQEPRGVFVLCTGPGENRASLIAAVIVPRLNRELKLGNRDTKRFPQHKGTHRARPAK